MGYARVSSPWRVARELRDKGHLKKTEVPKSGADAGAGVAFVNRQENWKMKQGRAQGVTLVELLISVSIVLATLLVGLPSFKAIQARTARSAVMLEFASSMALARSEAATRRTLVSVCPSPSGAACAGGVPPAWNQGWMLFHDANGNLAVDAGEAVLHAYQIVGGAFSLQGNEAVAGGVTFRSDGTPVAAGSFSYCDDSESRTLALNLLGRLRVDVTGPGCGG